jgi:mono/diheme cytochrome c family protein
VSRRRAQPWRRLLAAALLAVTLALACATTARDGLDIAKLPVEVRPDYAVFARRCSKCHQLSRPLGADVHDDAQWVDYVERMRRQPASGISKADTKPILRFLHYYSFSYGAAGATDGGTH